MPSGDFSRDRPHKVRRVNKAPRPTTVPTRYVAAPKRRPTPSFARPIGPVAPRLTQPPKPSRRQRQFQQVFGTPRQAAQRETRRAAEKRAQQVHAAARRDVLFALGRGPRRTLTSVGFAPSPKLQIGPQRPTPLPVVHGVRLTPRQIQRDMAAVLAPGHSRQKLAAIERLHVAGVSDPFGSTTHRERVARDRAALKEAQRTFLRRYRELSKLNYGIRNKPLSDREVLRRIRGRSAAELYGAVQSYQPSALAMQGARVQHEGLSFDLRAIPDALMTGLAAAGEGVRHLGGNSLAGNLAADALFLPIGAVGAAAATAAHPGEMLDAIKSGAIGSAIQGKDWRKVVHDHPLFSALEVLGATSAAGRTTGAVGRGVSRGRVFSTERAPLAHVDLPGTMLYDRRRYSKDVTRQAVQRAIDRALPDGPLVRVGDREVRAKLTPSRLHGEWRMRRMADYVASRANSRERVNREEMVREALRAAPVRSHRGGRVGAAFGEYLDRTLPAGPRYGETGFHPVARRLPKGAYRPEREIVSMVLEGVIRSPARFIEDLKKERTRLERAYKKLREDGDKADVIANRQRAAAIDRVLNDPKALRNAKGVFDSARRLAPMLRDVESEAIERGAMSPERAARSKLFPAAQAHQGAIHGPAAGERARREAYAIEADNALLDMPSGANPAMRAALEKERARAFAAVRESPESLTGPNGEFLSNRQIIEEFQRQGGDPETLAYLPHSMKLRGPAAMHQHFGQQRRNYEGAHSRTGEMFERGASPFDYEHIVDTLAGKSNVVGNIREYDHLLQATGIRHRNGQYLTADEARRWIKNRVDDEGNPLPPGLVAKRAFNSRVSDEQQALIESQQQVASARGGMIEKHYEARTVPKTGPTSQARNVVLIPGTIDQRLANHIGVAGKATAAVQTAQGLFRRAVLPLSTKWMFGNVAEAVLRSATAGVAPGRDNLIGRRVIKALIAEDKRTGKAFEAEAIGGLHIGNRGLSNKRGPSTKNVPVVNELVQTLKMATDAGFAFNRMVEREFQYAALGKFARQQMQEMTGSWFKAMRAQRSALRDVAKGLKDTPAQIQAARYLDETLGQYSRFSPAMRGIIQTYTPFLPWYLNSVRFVAWTLPAKHPLKTSLLGLAEEQFQADYDAQHNDKLTRKGDLATAIKTKDGGWVPAARYTPFGFLGPLAAGDASDLAALFMPQISGPLLALRGIDPFGNEMTIPKKYGGTGERIEGGDAMKIALNQLIESFVPGVSMARRLREGGETALPTSNLLFPKTKPGSSAGQSAVERVFSPLRPIYLRKPGGAKGWSTDPVDQLLQGIDSGQGIDEKAVNQILNQLG